VFTGLIQSLGTVDAIDPHHLTISWSSGLHSAAAFRDVALGDSIAVDGICLTVTQILSQGFTAAVSPETLKRTTLGYLAPRSIVNLEASLRVGSKLGGHFVTGHIDGIGHLQSSVQTENAWDLTIDVPEAIARYIVQKGSVAINGISLTVANCSPTGARFSVAVIPLTYSETNLQFLPLRGPVNVEADVLGKYVEKFLSHGSGQGSRAADANSPDIGLSNGYSDTSEVITPTFLADHGYG